MMSNVEKGFMLRKIQIYTSIEENGVYSEWGFEKCCGVVVKFMKLGYLVEIISLPVASRKC